MPRLEEIVDTKRLERAADGVLPSESNPLMGRLIEMRETRPKSFAGLSPAIKLALRHRGAQVPQPCAPLQCGHIPLRSFFK
ncbi:MAG: hypothetical protein DMF64_12905 [Acidobacteria bacterium]|nr:MAG: hypothetical protein DMF64_12905 [Acidobacteriota bacterium]